MTGDIPITFTHQGKTYSGSFGKVAGTGDTSVWHLMSDDKRYLGRLGKANGDWVFHGSGLEYKARDFANFLFEKGAI